MKHEAFPGVVGDDTHIFLEAAALSGSSVEPGTGVAVELVDQPKKLQILADVARMSRVSTGVAEVGDRRWTEGLSST